MAVTTPIPPRNDLSLRLSSRAKDHRRIGTRRLMTIRWSDKEVLVVVGAGGMGRRPPVARRRTRDHARRRQSNWFGGGRQRAERRRSSGRDAAGRRHIPRRG